MSAYIAFSSPESGSVLVEVDPTEISKLPQIEKGEAVVAGKITDNLAKAGTALEAALKAAISSSISAFYSAVTELKVKTPTEVEMAFALKATGELGGGQVAIGKIGGEANYSVKVTWKSVDVPQPKP